MAVLGDAGVAGTASADGVVGLAPMARDGGAVLVVEESAPAVCLPPVGMSHRPAATRMANPANTTTTAANAREEPTAGTAGR